MMWKYHCEPHRESVFSFTLRFKLNLGNASSWYLGDKTWGRWNSLADSMWHVNSVRSDMGQEKSSSGGERRCRKHLCHFLLSSAVPSLPLSPTLAQVRADWGCWQIPHVMNSGSCQLRHSHVLLWGPFLADNTAESNAAPGHCNRQLSQTPRSVCHVWDMVHIVQNALHLHSSGCTLNVRFKDCEYWH